MALASVQIEGADAREVVRRSWSAATSCFTGADTAEIYDATTGTVLGTAQAADARLPHGSDHMQPSKMNQFRRFALMNVWTPSQAIAGVLAALLLLTLVPMGVMSASGTVAGLTGGFVLMHLALHGWTPLRGSMTQRIALLLVWLVALVVGGLVATLLGFK